MSRTSKDNPIWVRAYREDHPSGRYSVIHDVACFRGQIECDADQRPNNRGEYDQQRCVKHVDIIWFYSRAHPDDARRLYTKVERQKEHVDLLNAKKMYNAGDDEGINDFDFYNRQNTKQNGARFR